MSHEEPRRDILPSRLADHAPPSPAYTRPDARGGTPPRASQPLPTPPRLSIGERLGRAFRRHWWQIVPLWALASAGIWYGLPRWIPNSYEAASEVEVAAGGGAGVGDKKSEADFETVKETQARRLANPTIVKSAVQAEPGLGQGLADDEKVDPETAILRRIAATLQPKTNVIRVSLTARHDRDLARVVDAVIKAYLDVANDFSAAGEAERSSKLRDLAQGKELQVKSKQAEVAGMVRKLGALDAEQGRKRHAAAIEQRAGLSDQLLKTDLEVVELQATVERVRREEAAQAVNPRPRSRTEAEAATAFYALPEVASLRNQRDELDQKLKLAERETGKGGEASRKVLQPRRDDFQRQINDLWAKLKPGLMIAAQADPTPEGTPESSRLEARIDGLKARQRMLNERLDSMNRETLSGGTEILALEFARQDLTRAEKVYGMMTDTLGQVEVASSQPPARFEQLYRARTVERTQELPRWAVGLTGPVAVLLGLLGFFGMVEQRAGRILDPADLPSRAGLHVIGLVPPLPRGRSWAGIPGAGGGRRSQVDVERFIQSLDQLRVIVCGRGDAQGRPRRSLLITSASQGEGKSTLAAQLAERSVNAGLLTLLVDADLRNPTLSRMFDRPESIGLANVLRGELLAEEAIGTVPEAGGFHFLSAGLVRDDLSRLLGSERLSRFLESARESFDLVLVDSPPVLPVADALTIGRWVDGAILTVRHKVSRLPMVERATQQLASVGITVLGAVVSGVKDRHAPYYGPQPAAEGGGQGSGS